MEKATRFYRLDQEKNIACKDFSEAQKKAILKKDAYRCVMCGRTQQEGYDLFVIPIRPLVFGGDLTIENGQTLCKPHYLTTKENHNPIETGKKMFIKINEVAKKEQQKDLLAFTNDILEVFEKHGINGHIEWKR